MMNLTERVYNVIKDNGDVPEVEGYGYLLDASIFYIMIELGYDIRNQEIFDLILECADKGINYTNMDKMLVSAEI